ncbi:MAG: Hsp20/alpha crystallin family protein [Cyanobacteria bacterium J083]|nr:MAG: Hsp20/alpha crystallin family protein [Cyanobacteria bacterium J083]
MNIVRFSPIEQMERLRRQIDQIFADLEGVSPETNWNWAPPMELIDEPDNLILRLQLPGLDGKDIDIQVTREAVTISGEYPRPEGDSWRYLHSEFNYGKFQRQIPLPVPIVNHQAMADYEAGVLTLRLPKAEEAKQRVVKISLEGTTETNASLPEGKAAEESAVAPA